MHDTIGFDSEAYDAAALDPAALAMRLADEPAERGVAAGEGT